MAVSAVAAAAVLLTMAGAFRTDSLAAGCGASGADAVVSGAESPEGVPGRWERIFSDDFDGPRPDPRVWATTWFGGTRMSGATVARSNVRISGSCLVLSVDDRGRAAVVTSNPRNGDTEHGFQIGTDVVVEARVRLPGWAGRIHAWPAWWVNGQRWPRDGETDIVEGLKGRATTNYHSSGGHTVSDPVPGAWGGTWHTYALERGRGQNRIYWDGRLVDSYPTDDGGAPQYLVFTLRPSDPPDGAGAVELEVDYVRVWRSRS
jgi:hypothetical protein